jgi:CMP-N,N'-diacetyllegionaminic acid synthase
MKILALIPARGQSKGIPEKNTNLFNGEPLINWSIKAAKLAPSISEVVVSTEDDRIARIAINAGACIPFMRPSILSGDDSLVMDTIIYTISKIKGFDLVLLLQPTSPLRTAQDIEDIVKFRERLGVPAAVSVSECKTHPSCVYGRTHEERFELLSGQPFNGSRQVLPPVYIPNGALYLAECAWLEKKRSFVSEETGAFLMPPERSIDIDTEFDWNIAEFLFKNNRNL